LASVLHIEDAVITGDMLARKHGAEEEVCIGEAAIVTPTAWDYLRQKHLRLQRGAVEQMAAVAVAAEQNAVAEAVANDVLIAEAKVMDGLGRCEQPRESCGCQDEEFGSGYVEPSSCRDCVVYELKKKGDAGADCAGCNRRHLLDGLIESGQGVDPEQLIREVTALVVHRLED